VTEAHFTPLSNWHAWEVSISLHNIKSGSLCMMFVMNGSGCPEDVKNNNWLGYHDIAGSMAMKMYNTKVLDFFFSFFFLLGHKNQIKTKRSRHHPSTQEHLFLLTQTRGHIKKIKKEKKRNRHPQTFFMTLACKDSCIHLTCCLKALWNIQKISNRAVRNIFKSQQRNSPLQFF
jgi:hypothetical protein